jgi:nitroreductase
VTLTTRGYDRVGPNKLSNHSWQPPEVVPAPAAISGSGTGHPTVKYHRDMETWDAIRSRRKILEYADRPIEDEKLEQILEAGRRAPSSRNSQRWDFVVVKDKERLSELTKVWQGAAHLADAPVALGIVAPEVSDIREVGSVNFDLGQAVMSMMIAAADLGIGTRHASVHDYDLGAEILGLPEGKRLTWLFGLGYPGDRPIKPIVNPTRRPLDEVVHFETW